MSKHEARISLVKIWIDITVKALEAEGVDADVIDRVRERLVYGTPKRCAEDRHEWIEVKADGYIVARYCPRCEAKDDYTSLPKTMMRPVTLDFTDSDDDLTEVKFVPIDESEEL